MEFTITELEFTITKKDIQKIKDFIEAGTLVHLMNNEGLSFSAMALILSTIRGTCEQLTNKMEETEENDRI